MAYMDDLNHGILISPTLTLAPGSEAIYPNSIPDDSSIYAFETFAPGPSSHVMPFSSKIPDASSHAFETSVPSAPSSHVVTSSSQIPDASFHDVENTIPPAPSSHVVTSSYHPIRADEMLLQAGDLIIIEKEYSDGWARVRNVSHGYSLSNIGILI